MQQGFKMLHFLEGILHIQKISKNAAKSVSINFKYKIVLIVVPTIFDGWED